MVNVQANGGAQRKPLTLWAPSDHNELLENCWNNRPISMPVHPARRQHPLTWLRVLIGRDTPTLTSSVRVSGSLPLCGPAFPQVESRPSGAKLGVLTKRLGRPGLQEDGQHTPFTRDSGVLVYFTEARAPW
jgi:hypothetical protein